MRRAAGWEQHWFEVESFRVITDDRRPDAPAPRRRHHRGHDQGARRRRARRSPPPRATARSTRSTPALRTRARRPVPGARPRAPHRLQGARARHRTRAPARSPGCWSTRTNGERDVDDDRREREHHRGVVAGAVRLARLRPAPVPRPAGSSTPPCPPTRSSPPSSTTTRARSRTSRRACTCRPPQAWRADRPGDLAAGQPTGDAARAARARTSGTRSRSPSALRDRVALGAARARRRRARGGRRAGDEARGVVRAGADDARRRHRGRAARLPGRRRPATFARWRAAARARRRPRVRRPPGDRRRGARRGAAAAAAGAGAARRVPRRAAAVATTGDRAARPRDDRPRPVLARADGLAPRRQRAHRAVQLAVRPPPRRRRSSCASRTPTSPASRDEWVVGIQDTLRWLGLDWDEGPFLQSDRARRVPRRRRPRCSRDGHAYECFCTEDEVKERNDAAMAAGPSAGLRRPLPRPHRRRAGRARGRGPAAHVVRFRTPDDGVEHASPTSIRGEVRVEWSTSTTS